MENDCKSILKIPISMSPANDTRYWFYAKDGKCTVKSEYWLGLLGRQAVHNNSNDLLAHCLELRRPTKAIIVVDEQNDCGGSA